VTAEILSSWGARHGGRPYKKGLRAEEDGFALEHFDGEEEGDGGVDTVGCKNDDNQIPMIGAGD
jgi:hypothetical protein